MTRPPHERLNGPNVLADPKGDLPEHLFSARKATILGELPDGGMLYFDVGRRRLESIYPSDELNRLADDLNAVLLRGRSQLMLWLGALESCRTLCPPAMHHFILDDRAGSSELRGRASMW